MVNSVVHVSSVGAAAASGLITTNSIDRSARIAGDCPGSRRWAKRCRSWTTISKA